MTSARWPELPVLGNIALPALPGDADRVLWPGLFDLADNLPTHHVVIDGVMVHLHGTVVARHSQGPTRDVDVLLDVGVVPRRITTGLAEAIARSNHPMALPRNRTTSRHETRYQRASQRHR